MARSYDVGVFRANIESEIAEVSRYLARLEAAKQMVDAQGESVVGLVELLGKFAKAPRADEEPLPQINGKGPARKLLALINASPQPIPLTVLVERAKLAGSSAHGALNRLTKAGLVRRMGRGLYWKAGDNVPNNGKGEPLEDQIRAALKAAEGPLRGGQIRDAIPALAGYSNSRLRNVLNGMKDVKRKGKRAGTTYLLK